MKRYFTAASWLSYCFLSNAANAANGRSTVFGYYVNDPERFGVVAFDKDGHATSIEEKPAEPALLPEISYDDFAKLDLRLAKVIACEEVKKSKKLLKCTLQMGGEERIVLSGIKKWYSPEQLIGKTVVVAANLAPKTICGIESHGMILCASDASDENLSALTTMGDMASGLKVR